MHLGPHLILSLSVAFVSISYNLFKNGASVTVIDVSRVTASSGLFRSRRAFSSASVWLVDDM